MKTQSIHNDPRFSKESTKQIAHLPETGREINLGLISFLFLLIYILTMQLSHAQDCTGFRTQTQGGWGANPNGNNSGGYLHDNFAAAFPSGLTIGCDSHLLLLTSAQAVTDFLPSSTTPDTLPSGTLVDPGNSYKNVFAGQLEAAMLNIGFDLYDPDFSSNSIHLGDLIIVNGPFAGWTVSQLLVEANNAIGTCSSTYSLDDLNNALDSINNNYDNGTSDNGYLTCQPPCVCAPPSNLIVDSVSAAEARLCWDGIDCAQGYIVAWRTVPHTQ